VAGVLGRRLVVRDPAGIGIDCCGGPALEQPAAAQQAFGGRPCALINPLLLGDGNDRLSSHRVTPSDVTKLFILHVLCHV
jgi:hypothetical protein